MKVASLIAALSVIAIANAFALIHAARNRAGQPDAEIALTQKELRYNAVASGDDDSGVTLNLQWTGPGQFLPFQAGADPNWLRVPKLRQLGFDCSVDPSSPEATRFYERQRARRVFVAFEYDGPAWQMWLRAWQDASRFPAGLEDRSHLVAIDADLNPARLRSDHPDRTKVLVLPAVIAIARTGYPYGGVRPTDEQPTLHGYIREVPSSIHVPLPFSAEFRNRMPQRSTGVANSTASYKVKLRFGSAFEPEVTGVEFTQ